MSQPLRILTTEIQPWRLLKARAEADLGFEIEFIECDFISTQRRAAIAPQSYDIYDQCFHNLDIVWHWRAIQAIDTRRIAQWNDLENPTLMTRPDRRPGLGDRPSSRLYVQPDATLSSSPTGQISMLPTFYNFDSFAVEASDIDVDRVVTSWAEMLDPRWSGRVALVDEPAIGPFDLALALNAAGKMSFADMGNMSVSEIDQLIDHARQLVLSGHLAGFWRRATEPVTLFTSGELKLASIWSPAIVGMKAEGVKVRQSHPIEGYRAWHGGMCLSRHLEGARLDQAYDWLNWYLDGYAGALVARQGYYMSAPQRVRAYLTPEEWDYWYEGLPASTDLPDTTGRPAIAKGSIRSGGALRARARHIAIWNSAMDEHNYLVRRWNDVVALSAARRRPARRAG